MLPFPRATFLVLAQAETVILPFAVFHHPISKWRGREPRCEPSSSRLLSHYCLSLRLTVSFVDLQGVFRLVSHHLIGDIRLETFPARRESNLPIIHKTKPRSKNQSARKPPEITLAPAEVGQQSEATGEVVQEVREVERFR